MGMYHLSYKLTYICNSYFIRKYSTCSFHVLLNMRYVSTQDVNFIALFFTRAETQLFLVVFLSVPSKDGWNRE